jgi:flagellar motor switch protein FliG
MTAMAIELQSTRGAAVLLLALGENEAATVLKHLDAKVVQRLGTAMAQLKSASREDVYPHRG